MKKVDFKTMENLKGGDAIEGVCIGFGVGTAVLGAANVWNPAGWVLIGAAAGCGLYSIFK